MIRQLPEERGASRKIINKEGHQVYFILCFLSWHVSKNKQIGGSLKKFFTQEKNFVHKNVVEQKLGKIYTPFVLKCE